MVPRVKVHIGVGVDPGLVHTLTTTAANAHDVTKTAELLRGEKTVVFADSSYCGADGRVAVQQQHPDVARYVVKMPGKCKRLDKARKADALVNALECVRAGIRVKLDHPFRVLGSQFDHTEFKYEDLNTINLQTLFALVNI